LNILIGNKIIFSEVDEAKGFFKRLIGLMFKDTSASNKALFIRRCNWIHTFFMRFPISVIYIGADNVVVEVDPFVAPWKVCRPRLSAKHVLELEADPKRISEISKGEVLKCIA
jgi:uncharacterized membrane protein (UPF0127 family)